MPWSNSPDDRRRSSATYGADWRRARDAAMRRDQWRCQLRLEGCQGAASQVGHILAVADGVDHRLTNLRSVCTACHAKRTAQQGNQARRGRRNADPEPLQQRTKW